MCASGWTAARRPRRRPMSARRSRSTWTRPRRSTCSRPWRRSAASRCSSTRRYSRPSARASVMSSATCGALVCLTTGARASSTMLPMLGKTLCPHCLSRSVPRPAKGPVGLVACTDCRSVFAPQPDGGAAVLLPDHVAVDAARGRFAIVLRSYFVTFGHAECHLSFRLERDDFSWSAPPLLGPLRLSDARCSVPRVDVARFAWRRFGRRDAHQEHDVVSDLVTVKHDRSERRAGFAFPAGFPAGPAIATGLQWAHETWFTDGPAYRTAGTAIERPMLSNPSQRRAGRTAPEAECVTRRRAGHLARAPQAAPSAAPRTTKRGRKLREILTGRFSPVGGVAASARRDAKTHGPVFCCSFPRCLRPMVSVPARDGVHLGRHALLVVHRARGRGAGAVRDAWAGVLGAVVGVVHSRVVHTDRVESAPEPVATWSACLVARQRVGSPDAAGTRDPALAAGVVHPARHPLLVARQTHTGHPEGRAIGNASASPSRRGRRGTRGGGAARCRRPARPGPLSDRHVASAGGDEEKGREEDRRAHTRWRNTNRESS